MAARAHDYVTRIVWTGDEGAGTRDYTSYSREHLLTGAGKAEVALSSDPAFRGDPTRWNPEELLLASLSSCHMLWYLHLASQAGIVVRACADRATGRMVETDRGGHFEEVVLHPVVTVESGSAETAIRLHHEAHQKCFVANSVNVPVRCEPTVTSGPDPAR